MQIAIVGLGKMGGNMVKRLLGGGHQVVAWDRDAKVVETLSKAGATGATSLADLVGKLSGPRAVWVMVPAGAPTESTIKELASLLSADDIVIDGGNSNYKDSIRRSKELAEKKIRFSSAMLPKWARRSRSLDALLPVLYLRGISMGNFQEALAAILGKDAPNLSPDVVSRLTGEWQQEYDRWQRRDLSARRYVYIWADGVYLQARMEPQAECMLVILGATPEGKKELVGFQVGLRESAQSWRELLIDIKARGLAVPPEIAVGDGAMGFWKALDEVFPGTRHQRCWVHKIANVLNKFPKSMQPAVKADLREIWQAETRAVAQTAMNVFAEKYGAKYEKAVTCLTKDSVALLAFYDFPADHWDHLRTGNPIESVFATVRHRTVRTKGALSQKSERHELAAVDLP